MWDIGQIVPTGGPVYWRLKRCFPLLELNGVGLCQACEDVAQRTRQS